MKKLIIPVVLTAALAISSCGKSKDSAPSASLSASPKATSAASVLPSDSPSRGMSDPDSTAASQNDGGDNDNIVSSEDDGNNGNIDRSIETDGETENSGETETQADSVSIINGSSVPFYAVYLSTSSDGNPGENIIGDTPLGEGEEIVLPFANAPDEDLTVMVEDENGARYSTGGISLANGLAIELRLNGGSLEAIVQ